MPSNGGFVRTRRTASRWRLARTMVVLAATLGVVTATGGAAVAEMSFGNGEQVIIDSVHVGYPALSTSAKCGKKIVTGLPGGIPVTVVATFVKGDGSGPTGPYGGLENWSGGMVSAPDDHYGTGVGGNQTQFFHTLAYPGDGWYGPGAYSFDAFAQDVGLAGGYTDTEKTFGIPGYPPSGGGEVVKCPFAHPFDINNVLSDMAKSGAEEVLGGACEGCKSFYDAVKHALDYNDLFNSVLKNSIVDDPPDANYQQIVTPQSAPVLDPPAGLTSAQDTTLLNLESEFATDIGLDRALMTSENRAWGALNGGDRYAYLQQTKAVADFADQLANRLGGIDQLYADFQAAFAPSFTTPFSITMQDVAKYQADSYAGVMPDEAAVLSQLGATTDDEAQIIDAIISVDATKLSAADGVNALFQQDDAALVSPLQGLATWARNVASTPPPVVADVSPRTLNPSGGQQVTVTGSNLTGVTALTFGASTPTSGQGVGTSCSSDSECTTYAPPGHGTVDVVAVGPGGPSETGPKDTVSYVAPAKPQITHVTPASGPISGNTNVSITGSGLSGGIVYFGPTPSESVRCTDTLCTAYSPTAASPGAVDIQVQTDGGLSDTSSADQFDYLASSGTPPGAPSITGVTPSSGSDLGGETVTIHGSNFTGANTVQFGTFTDSSSFQVVDDSTITAVVPPDYTPETVDVQVYGPGGASTVTTADHFTYLATPPSITGISPSSGPNTGGTPFTITGTNLGYQSTNIEIGGAYVADAVCADTTCTGTSPVGDVGTADVTVWTDNGQATLPGAFTYVAGPLPVIDGVTPDTGDISGGTSVVISGSHLSGGHVTFGGADGAGETCTDTTCVATAPAADKGGLVDVQVTTAAGSSAITSADTYSYVHLAAPVVTAVSPDSGYLAGFDDVRISGSDLDGGTVSFGGVEAYGVTCTMTFCDASVPAGAGPGPVVVTVTTASGTSSTTPAPENEYTYLRPAVTGVSPSSGWTSGGTKLTITGTDLPGTTDLPDDSTQIRFGSNYSATGTCTGTSCTVTAPSVASTVGAVDVTVEGGLDTWSPATPADVFTYFVRPAPTVTSISPSSGTDRGGDQVTVNGTDLDGGTIAIGSAGTTGTCGHTSCTVVTHNAPSSVDGTYAVSATTAGGTSPASGVTFTYAPPAAPTITGITPSSGTIVGGSAVTITGTNLTGGAVLFGGKSATGVTCYVDTCTVTTPSQTSAGTVTVKVTTSGLTTGGGSATTSYDYVVPPAPVVTAVNPSGGPQSGGTPFSVAGTDLDAGSVTVGGIAATSVTCHPTYCQGMSPAGTTGAADVVVTTPGGASAVTPADQFTYSPVSITEHAIPGVSNGTGAGGVVRGDNGDMWFAMPNLDKIGRVSHTDGTVSTYAAVRPASGSGTASPNGIALGPDGRIYYAERNTDVIVAIDDAGNQQSYQLPGSAGDPGGSVGDLRFVTAGPDGRMWFTLGFSGAVGALNPTSGAVQVWHLPNPWVLPYNIVAGPDGRMWFTEVYGDSLGAITTDGTITEYPLPTPGSWGWGLTVGADNRLWLGETMARDVAAVTTDGVATAYSVPNELDDPQGVISGADGRIWFTAPDHDTINALDPSSGDVTEYAMPPGNPVGEAPRYLAMDSSGTLWVTENLGAHILSVSGITSASPPAVTALSPDHGAAGTTVTISGSNLQGASGVSFGGVPATSYTVDDPVHITAVAPAGTGTVDVTVATGSGTSPTTASDRFNYGSSSPSPPDVRGVSPDSGPVAGGTAVTITGRHLAGGTVAFGGVAATGVTCADTSCTATSPAGAAGPVDVTVTTSTGASAVVDADTFVYLTPNPAAPTVTGVSPASGPDSGGTAVTVTGTNLSGASIDFGVELANDASCTATSCTVTTPRGGAGPVDVRVTTPGGTSPRTSSDAFTYVATTKSPLSVTVTPSTASFGYSQSSESFSAHVSPAVAGDMQFYVDGAAVGTPVHSDTGDGYVSSTYFSGPSSGGDFAVGSHPVSAVFTPVDSDYYANGTGTTSFSVTQASTQVTTGTYSTSPTAGQTVAIYAQVNPWQAAGTVQFSDGAVALGTPVPVSSGSAYIYQAFSAGAHTIHAAFSPTDSTDYAASTGSFTLNVGGVTATPDTTSLAISGPTSASYGATVRFSATLRDVTKSSSALSGASVRLYKRSSSKSSWTLVTTKTTSSTGVATASFAARRYEQLRWTYAGNASHAAASSSIKTLTVRQVVTIRTTRSKIAAGRTFKLYGWVSPSGGGQRVYLQQKSGSRWKTLTSVLLKKQRLPNGSTRVGFVFARKIARVGKYTFRVRKPATSTLAAGYSKTITITIT